MTSTHQERRGPIPRARPDGSAQRLTTASGPHPGPADEPPRKKPRRDGFLDRTLPDRAAEDISMALSPSQSPGLPLAPKPRTRNISACENCRSRKTKCDNQRPSCDYCARTKVPCHYADDAVSATLSVASRLLEALENLTNLISAEQSQRLRQNQVTQLEPGNSPHRQSTQGLGHYSPSQDGSAPRFPDPGPEASPHSLAEIQGSENAYPPQAGLDSVLSWPIFPNPLPDFYLEPPPETRDHLSAALPNIDHSELTRLKARFLSFVYPKNPIIDVGQLEHLVDEVAENGLSWTSGTCLVALVCALGALSEEYSPIRSGLPNDRGSEASDDQSKIASGFWGVALKRFGLVIGQPTSEAVQCLCLAGIYQMYEMEPVRAWHYFHLASTAWYVAKITYQDAFVQRSDDALQRTSNLTLEQSLYFTCFKSELELTFELPFPVSLLPDFRYPYTFPNPPNLDYGPSNIALESQQKSWCYYLAEIACRHLVNRIIQAHGSFPSLLDVSAVQRLVRELQIFEDQLAKWHESLPESIRFELPADVVVPLDDELQQHLRGRYMSIKELVYRPFVRICTTEKLNLPPDLISYVASLASESLRYSCLRFQAYPIRRHHGLWFQFRNFTASALIMIAASKAKQSAVPNAAAEICFPLDWSMQMLQTKNMFAPYCQQPGGWMQKCEQLLDWAMHEFHPTWSLN